MAGFDLSGSGIITRPQDTAGGPDATEGHHTGLGITLIGEVDGALGSGHAKSVGQIKIVVSITVDGTGEISQTFNAKLGISLTNEVGNGCQTHQIGIRVGAHLVGGLSALAETAWPGDQGLVTGGGMEHVIGTTGVISDIERQAFTIFDRLTGLFVDHCQGRAYVTLARIISVLGHNHTGRQCAALVFLLELESAVILRFNGANRFTGNGVEDIDVDTVRGIFTLDLEFALLFVFPLKFGHVDDRPDINRSCLFPVILMTTVAGGDLGYAL